MSRSVFSQQIVLTIDPHADALGQIARQRPEGIPLDLVVALNRRWVRVVPGREYRLTARRYGWHRLMCILVAEHNNEIEMLASKLIDALAAL
jgi:hypothetical protein